MRVQSSFEETTLKTLQQRRHLANAIRVLSMDAVQKANSGHPGMPMGMADIAEVLWNDFLVHNPQNPQWSNRDRFILSNGHGCLLQYALLHFSGYELSLEDIKQFRQIHSKTPGHPEFGVTPGVEATTGPLGQGFANAVGMALSEQLLAAEFNRDNFNVVDHFTYCFVGDGCLMEGISHEVASLAGTLGLGKLIVFWDDNGVSIDGQVKNWFADDTAKRFEAYGWHVIPNIDGHNAEEIKAAIQTARQITNKPSFLACKTIIGFGAPSCEGTEKCHGAALGETVIQEARQKLQWDHPPFEFPKNIYEDFDAKVKGSKKEAAWHTLFNHYHARYPELAAEFSRRMTKQLPADFLENTQSFIKETQAKLENIATRKASQHCLNLLVPLLPELLGGSADLSESNLTLTPHSKPVLPHQLKGNYIFYGVREFGMSAMMNGMALHGGFIPYGGTFLTFLDYARNAVRMAALMQQRVIFVYTHDSIGLGEDGPTHQPIEHLAMLRATPNMSLWRPCDATETAVAWQMAIQRTEGPSSLALTRQVVPAQKRSLLQVADIAKGAYILRESEKIKEHAEKNLILIATGSEVSLAMQAAENLTQKGYGVRVVSMPSVDVFLKQEKAYQALVLPDNIKKRIAVEAAATLDWYRFVGCHGKVFGIDRFGESAPYAKIFEALHFNSENLTQLAEKMFEEKL